jgi:hypothetical protein
LSIPTRLNDEVDRGAVIKKKWVFEEEEESVMITYQRLRIDALEIAAW